MTRQIPLLSQLYKATESIVDSQRELYWLIEHALHLRIKRISPIPSLLSIQQQETHEKQPLNYAKQLLKEFHTMSFQDSERFIDKLEAQDKKRLERWIQWRARGKPLQYILGITHYSNSSVFYFLKKKAIFKRSSNLYLY